MAQPKDASSEPKKPAKKLVIVDANEEAVAAKKDPVLEKKKITVIAHEGDTPAVDPTEVKKDLEVAKTEVTESQTDEQQTIPDELPKEITIADAIDAAKTEVSTPEEDQPIADTDSEVVETETEAVNESASEAENPIDSEPEEAAASVETEEEPEDTTQFDDPTIVNAVDDIVASESDQLLEREDEIAKKAIIEQKKKTGVKAFFKNWWKNPATKWGTICGLFIILVGIVVLPASRYSILNAAGVRVKASVIVISNDTQQPLKNADVSLGGQTVKTDEKGVAAFDVLRLGKTTLKIQKRGYGTVEQSKTLGWGSNPFGQLGLAVTGSQFTFTTTDYLSGKPVIGAEAVYGDFNAQADKDGKIILPIDSAVDGDIEVTIRALDYRDEKLKIAQNDTTVKKIALVAARHHVFVSKRSGKYDIYKIDADGKNESILVAATGQERSDLALLPHPSKNLTALVTTRDGKRNKDGFLLSVLYVVNVDTGEMTKVSQSERIRLIDWVGDRIVFISVTEGASAANPSRSKLFSFEPGQPGAKELASANYFNDATVFKGQIYYAPSSYAVPVSSVKFYRINADGSGVATLLDKEVWTVFRTDYDTLQLNTSQDWYELKSGSLPTKLTAVPSNATSVVYKDSPDKKHALWTDTRDGKGVVLLYDVDSKKDTVLHTQAGVSLPLNWLSNTTYVFRISDGHELADYVKSIDGGDAKKLRDVTSTDFSNYFN